VRRPCLLANTCHFTRLLERSLATLKCGNGSSISLILPAHCAARCCSIVLCSSGCCIPGCRPAGQTNSGQPADSGPPAPQPPHGECIAPPKIILPPPGVTSVPPQRDDPSSTQVALQKQRRLARNRKRCSPHGDMRNVRVASHTDATGVAIRSWQRCCRTHTHTRAHTHTHQADARTTHQRAR